VRFNQTQVDCVVQTIFILLHTLSSIPQYQISSS
jgi:hypothetical protein